MVVERASRAELERTFHELVFKLKLDLELTRTIYHGIGLLEIEICKELFYKIESTLDFLLTSCTAYNHKLEMPLNGKHGFLNVVEAFAMMVASLVSLFEFTGTSYAAARYGSATPVSPYIISHGASWVVRFNISI
ncbi:hypothetical protein P8452_61186 [Trifolium repens]|nr:hypothetical protein P8452_61186 [Trifolium repens]